MVPEVFHNLSVESKHHRQTWLPNPINRTLESENSHQHTGTSSLLLSCTSPEISLPPSSLGYHWNGKHKTSFMDRVLPYLITEALRSYLLFSKTNSKPTRQKARHCKDRLSRGTGGESVFQRRVSGAISKQPALCPLLTDVYITNAGWKDRRVGFFVRATSQKSGH